MKRTDDDQFDLSSSAECKTLENLFRDAVKAVCIEFAGHDIRQFTFEMKGSGRTHSGDAKIEFILTSGYGDQRVSSHSIKPLLPEIFRRHGFEMENQPLMLSSPEKASDEDDSIPV